LRVGAVGRARRAAVQITGLVAAVHRRGRLQLLARQAAIGRRLSAAVRQAQILVVAAQIVPIRVQVGAVRAEVTPVGMYVLTVRPQVMHVRTDVRTVLHQVATIRAQFRPVLGDVGLVVGTALLRGIVVPQVSLVRADVRTILGDVLPVLREVATVRADVGLIAAQVVAVLRDITMVAAHIGPVVIEIAPVVRQIAVPRTLGGAQVAMAVAHGVTIPVEVPMLVVACHAVVVVIALLVTALVLTAIGDARIATDALVQTPDVGTHLIHVVPGTLEIGLVTVDVGLIVGAVFLRGVVPSQVLLVALDVLPVLGEALTVGLDITLVRLDLLFSTNPVGLRRRVLAFARRRAIAARAAVPVHLATGICLPAGAGTALCAAAGLPAATDLTGGSRLVARAARDWRLLLGWVVLVGRHLRLLGIGPSNRQRRRQYRSNRHCNQGFVLHGTSFAS